MPYRGPQHVSMAELRTYVLARDGRCIMRSYPGHVCYARFGHPWDLAKTDADFSLEHVTGVHGHMDPRRDDDAHCVALCTRKNIEHTNKEERAWIRERLREMHPVCGS